MNTFQWLWIIWVAMFAGVETLAIVNKKKQDTLSENLRAVFHTSTKWGRYLWIIFIGLLFTWLAVHIAVEGSA